MYLIHVRYSYTSSIDVVTSSLPSPRPRPPVPKRRQRSQSLISQSLIVGRIPNDFNQEHVKLCLESLSNKSCRQVKMKNQMALVEMHEPISMYKR